MPKISPTFKRTPKGIQARMKNRLILIQVGQYLMWVKELKGGGVCIFSAALYQNQVGIITMPGSSYGYVMIARFFKSGD